MSKGEIIPRTIEDFHLYIQKTNARQLAVNPDSGNPFWKDYNWTSTQSVEYKNRRDKWVDTVYEKYSDELTSTSTAKRAVPKFIRSLSDYAKEHRLIEKIKSCDIASLDDAMIWNFVLQRKKRSFRKEAIQKTVAALVESRGHGVISCKVRVTKSEGRRKIPRDEGADSVQYAWAAVNKDENISLDINGSFYKKDISTKAIFQFETGHENITKWLVIHFRWYNTKHPHLSGVWSEPQRLVIG